MRVLDLFSGIGGFSLGLERAGMKTVAFCEIEEFPRKVLKKHWPEVPIYEDVRTLTAARLASDGISVDVICGGFPCQDISNAGNKAGITGERSGLWKEYARLIGEIRPQFAIMENVSALLYRGLGDVLGDLAEVGYDAEWHCISASYVGAPHRRDRIWIVAYPMQRSGSAESWEQQGERAEVVDSGRSGNVADSHGAQREGGWLSRRIYQEHRNSIRSSWWEVEPALGRVANGVPNQSHRLKAIGNAVVPQIPELIGKAIMEAA